MDNFPRWCALCDRKVKQKERLCSEHKNLYEDQLTTEWLSGIIAYSEYEYRLARREFRNRVQSLEKLVGQV